ncbi:SIS domain protein [Marvinbryantia formatexigens DSM 14469]|uniref:SIS domain protein n=1 Tax=Marvinbryantia formatexigens DSM 14469 TaxID=478749 RepID=C6L8R9_9FIRM|nr:MurR/RpiR family transcriptional regulator [Marvinbryantia formatexigens]EET62658.1 SIS domain protein [Marvinbryantia formatexigens DSM 14469]UWO23038.1 MurR/RpiR family transcriptional regulator [Marvinbryantia formatexigens DSM 14469]SDF96786.1 transcriptional regulator, RpiR family [Marvinbryantia formatexigens]
MKEDGKIPIPFIRTKYESFTQIEKCIADFFTDEERLSGYGTEELAAKNVAERLFVSEASLSRFAKKCGFRGYREMIYQYEKSLRDVRRKKHADNNIQMVLDLYQEVLNKTYNLVDETQILHIVRCMNTANRVYVCGMGSSGQAACEMESRFARIGVDIDSIQDADRMRMQTVFMNPGKLVIGLSLSGETEEVLYLLRESGKRKAQTVLFTANEREQLRQYCTEVVRLPSFRYMNFGNVISPQLPLLILIDILYHYYVNQDRYLKKSLHGDTLTALNEGRRLYRTERLPV